MARLFYALEPDGGVRDRIAAIQAQLELPARRVPAANLHVTLAFLGEVDDTGIDRLLEVGSERKFPACEITLDTCGWFPRSGVVWLGGREIPEALLSFQASLSARLADLGFRADSRPWRPHVTLYRKMRKRSPRIHVEAVHWTVSGFSLMQSTFAENGVIYTPLDRWEADAGG